MRPIADSNPGGQLLPDIEAISKRKTKVYEIEAKLQDVANKRSKLLSDVSAYESFSVAASQAKVILLSKEIEELCDRENKEARRIAELESSVTQVSMVTCSPIFFWKYISSEQTKNRAHLSILNEEIKKSTQALGKYRTTRKEKSETLSSEEERRRRHDSFDIEKARRDLDECKVHFSETSALLDRAKSDLSSLEAKLSPHIAARERVIAEIKKCDDDLLLAEKYNSALDKASDDAKARRNIHKQCEDYFGEGRPYKVIDAVSSKKQRASRDLQKIDQRLSDETRKHEMEVNSIIIDGNNLCYSSDNEFISLSALRPLAHHLKAKFDVTVVFDASIRKLLRVTSQDIQNNLGRGISTYVAPSKNAADEYILKLAQGNSGSYIITNDRYSEWHDYDAVRESRVINFLVANNRLMVNDLDITIDI